MATHYFVGTGWAFHAWEPTVDENRRSGIRADVDLQLVVGGVLVDLQVKASGTLGLHDSEVDAHIRQGVRNAADQLPAQATRPSLIVMSAQHPAASTFPSGTARFVGTPTDAIQLHDDGN